MASSMMYYVGYLGVIASGASGAVTACIEARKETSRNPTSLNKAMERIKNRGRWSCGLGIAERIETGAGSQWIHPVVMMLDPYCACFFTAVKENSRDPRSPTTDVTVIRPCCIRDPFSFLDGSSSSPKAVVKEPKKTQVQYACIARGSGSYQWPDWFIVKKQMLKSGSTMDDKENAVAKAIASDMFEQLTRTEGSAAFYVSGPSHTGKTTAAKILVMLLGEGTVFAELNPTVPGVLIADLIRLRDENSPGETLVILIDEGTWFMDIANGKTLPVSDKMVTEIFNKDTFNRLFQDAELLPKVAFIITTNMTKHDSDTLHLTANGDSMLQSHRITCEYRTLEDRSLDGYSRVERTPGAPPVYERVDIVGIVEEPMTPPKVEVMSLLD